MTEGDISITTRRQIRQILLWGHAETLQEGEICSFLSGTNNITMKCLKAGIFEVTYEPRESTIPHTSERFVWNARDNTWDKV
jgi:hypothetical protein